MSDHQPIYRNIHTWSHPKLSIKFTTLPVAAYGKAQFFEFINDALNDHRTVFSDNIIWNNARPNKELLFVFKDTALKKPKNCQVIDVMEKNKLMQQGFLSFQAGSKMVRGLGQALINKIIGQPLVKNYFREKLLSMENRAKKVDEFKPLFNLLFKEHINRNISDEILKYHNYFKNKKTPARAAIVCEGDQMKMIFRILKNLGYKWQLNKRLEIF